MDSSLALRRLISTNALLDSSAMYSTAIGARNKQLHLLCCCCSLCENTLEQEPNLHLEGGAVT